VPQYRKHNHDDHLKSSLPQEMRRKRQAVGLGATVTWHDGRPMKEEPQTDLPLVGSEAPCGAASRGTYRSIIIVGRSAALGCDVGATGDGGKLWAPEARLPDATAR
jgi:hypothetical protein